MKVSQLRDLTRKYASGRISREEYLAERKRMLDAITSGEETARYRELEPDTGADGERRLPRSRTLIAASLLIFLLLVAFATHLLSNGPAEDTRSSADSAPAPENPAIVLIREFNDQDDWSANALSALENDWNKLSAAQRTTARNSVPYRRLRREVDARIREHEALVASGGDPNALMKAARLRMFVERMGFTE